jgi:hypothetical protein
MEFRQAAAVLGSPRGWRKEVRCIRSRKEHARLARRPLGTTGVLHLPNGSRHGRCPEWFCGVQAYRLTATVQGVPLGRSALLATFEE